MSTTSRPTSSQMRESAAELRPMFYALQRALRDSLSQTTRVGVMSQEETMARAVEVLRDRRAEMEKLEKAVDVARHRKQSNSKNTKKKKKEKPQQQTSATDDGNALQSLESIVSSQFLDPKAYFVHSMIQRVIFDPSGCGLDMNHAFLATTNSEKEEFMGKLMIPELWQDHAFASLFRQTLYLAAIGVPVTYYTYIMKRADPSSGTLRRTFLQGIPCKLSTGEDSFVFDSYSWGVSKVPRTHPCLPGLLSQFISSPDSNLNPNSAASATNARMMFIFTDVDLEPEQASALQRILETGTASPSPSLSITATGGPMNQKQMQELASFYRISRSYASISPFEPISLSNTLRIESPHASSHGVSSSSSSISSPSLSPQTVIMPRSSAESYAPSPAPVVATAVPGIMHHPSRPPLPSSSTSTFTTRPSLLNSNPELDAQSPTPDCRFLWENAAPNPLASSAVPSPTIDISSQQLSPELDYPPTQQWLSAFPPTQLQVSPSHSLPISQLLDPSHDPGAQLSSFVTPQASAQPQPQSSFEQRPSSYRLVDQQAAPRWASSASGSQAFESSSLPLPALVSNQEGSVWPLPRDATLDKSALPQPQQPSSHWISSNGSESTQFHPWTPRSHIPPHPQLHFPAPWNVQTSSSAWH